MATSLPHREPRLPAPGTSPRLGWLRNAWIAFFVLVAAAITGSQIAAPEKRTLQVIAAGALGALALRLSSFSALLFLVVVIPFQKSTTYGGTNVAFVLVIFILWLARVTLHIDDPPRRSGLDLPVIILLGAYLLGFSQFDKAEQFDIGKLNLFSTCMHISTAYLILHLTRTEKQLRSLVTAVVVMAVLILLTAVFELKFPSRALVPGWIELRSAEHVDYVKRGLEIKNMRVGGLFGDYELLAEFCAMIFLVLWFVMLRARTLLQRSVSVGLILLDTFVLLATVTRGALISLAIAAAYLVWRTRRRIRFHVFAMGMIAVLAGGWLMLEFVANNTRSGNVLLRMEETKIVHGMPDNRVETWSTAWERIMKRPILGYGPAYAGKEGVQRIYFPHNNYLMYWHMIGIAGLAAFLWILWLLWRATDRAAPYLTHASYARGLLLALRAVVLLFAIDQMKIDYIRNDIYSYWVWIFFGLVLAAAKVAATEPVPVEAALAPARTLRPPRLAVAPLPPAT